MTRHRTILFALAVTLLIGGWFLAMKVVIPGQLRSGDPVTVAPLDYEVPRSWLVRPTTPPSAVWEEGWAIDFFVVPPAPQTAQPRGAVDPTSTEFAAWQLDQKQPLLDALSPHGAIYMPAIRWHSPVAETSLDSSSVSDDLTSSFQSYLDRDNRGRAVIFVLPSNLQNLLLSLERAVEVGPNDTSSRMAGVLFVGPRGFPPTTIPVLVCSAGLGDTCFLELAASQAPNSFEWLSVPLPYRIAPMSLDDIAESDRAIGAHVRAVLTDLENNVSKTAEPLEALEAVEIPTVRRPGQIDETGTTGD
ncbi:MAG: hypothetical protein AAF216_04415 [Pseudomonadota bacterium]